MIGLAILAAGLLNAAVDSYTVALAVQPRSRELKIRRIAVLLDAKEYQRAAAFAGEARKQHPDDPRFVRLQARALFDGGEGPATSEHHEGCQE